MMSAHNPDLDDCPKCGDDGCTCDPHAAPAIVLTVPARRPSESFADEPRCANCGACWCERVVLGHDVCSAGCEQVILREIAEEEALARELEYEIADDAVGVPSGSGIWLEENLVP